MFIFVIEVVIICGRMFTKYITADDYLSETGINFLLLMALEKVAYLPFAYIVDQVQ
jgi:hypothetical protein